MRKPSSSNAGAVFAIKVIQSLSTRVKFGNVPAFLSLIAMARDVAVTPCAKS